jgi:16S rRNA (guanine527-N7)-methyltransferase
MTHETTHVPVRGDLPDERWQEWQAYLAATFGITIAPESVGRFKPLLAELAAWNEKINLVSFRSADEVLWRHFADSLAALKLCADPGTRRAADIGAGAGFPGLPIACVYPGISLDFIESITKKCGFIEHMIATLSLTRTRVLNERAELLGQDAAHRERYDLVFSRAVAKFSPNLEIALPLLKPGGHLLLYKTVASLDGPEGVGSVTNALAHLGGELAGRFDYRIPGQEHTYCILDFVKTKHTPAQFPRRPGVPEKKPL